MCYIGTFIFIFNSFCQSHNADHKAEEGTKQKNEEIHRLNFDINDRLFLVVLVMYSVAY